MSTRSERLIAAADLRHVASMLDMEQIPALSPLAVEQVRVVIRFLQQQAAALLEDDYLEVVDCVFKDFPGVDEVSR